jgi:hypothetical protein
LEKGNVWIVEDTEDSINVTAYLERILRSTVVRRDETA